MSFKLPVIPSIDETVQAAVRARQQSLTKPPGSLGRLEELTIQLAGICGSSRLSLARKAVIIMVGDHGVTVAGVSPYPSEVTGQMVSNFLAGGAAINSLARYAEARVVVVDVGVAGELPTHPALVARKVKPGTDNFLDGAAMSRIEAEQAIETGMQVLATEAEQGLDLVATGDMGIGNTTAAALLTGVFCGAAPDAVTGRGTGVDDAGLAHKIDIVTRVLETNAPDPNDPLDVLRKVGGLEIAGLIGVILGAAARRIPVVLDGFISGAAALVAVALAPDVKPYLIAGHRSAESGHRIQLEQLGLRPLLELDMRLGEGSGAALAFHIVEAAVRTFTEMATFDEAGVSDREAE